MLILLIIVTGVSEFVKHGKGENYLSKFFVEEASHQVNDDVELPPERTPKLVFTNGTVPVYQYGMQNEIPHIFIMGDSHADHYTYYFKNINTVPVYMALHHGNMAYGPIFTGIDKDTTYITPDDRQKFFQTYATVISWLKPGDKVILANRWDIHYVFSNLGWDLLDNDKNFNDYLKKFIDDIDFMVSQHPELKFYLVGQGVLTSGVVVECLKTDLSNSTFAFGF